MEAIDSEAPTGACSVAYTHLRPPPGVLCEYTATTASQAGADTAQYSQVTAKATDKYGSKRDILKRHAH